MKRFLLGLIGLSLISLVGCKGVKEIIREVPVEVHDSTQIVKEVHDSTYIDRWHTIEIKGDSVIMHDSIVMYRYIVKTDTLLDYIERPITVTQTEYIEVKKPLGWWQKTLMGIGLMGLIGLIGYVVWKTKKWWGWV